MEGKVVLGGDAHKFVELFRLCWNDISCYGYDKEIESILDNISFPKEPHDSIGVYTQLRLNNFLRSTKDNQLKTIKELLKIAETAINRMTNDFIRSSLLKQYENCQKIIQEKMQATPEQHFLTKKFDPISFESLSMEDSIIKVLQQRYREVLICIENKASLAVVILCGSILEAVLLGVAVQNRNYFEQNIRAPKNKKGEIRCVEDWKLTNLIDVACDLKILKEDVRQFSHSLRDFRNYIHPYKQIQSEFNPDADTANICHQVLIAAVNDLKTYKKKNE